MDYYKKQFKNDLLQYCKERSEIVLFRATVLRNTPEFQNARHISFGIGDWEPTAKYDFYFCLYFTVLTDMVLHAHFPKQHAQFDEVSLYPKLFGMKFTQRLLPKSVLDHVRFRRADAQVIEQLWLSYCAYFIRDWQQSLLYTYGVDGCEFLRALISDRDLQTSVGRKSLMYAEKENGGCARPDGFGYCFDPSGYFESLLLELVKKELDPLTDQR